MKNLTAIALALLLTTAGAPLAAAPDAGAALRADAAPYADAAPHADAALYGDPAKQATSLPRPELDGLRTIDLESAEGGRWSKLGCTTLLLSGIVYIVLGEGTKQPRLKTYGNQLLGMSQIMCV